MNHEFDALVQETFSSLMEFKPDLATQYGLHQYDKNMPSATKEAQVTFISFLDEYLQKFQSFQGELSPSEKIDKNVMISVLKYYLFEEKEIRQWEKDPDVAEILGSALVPLFAREFAPFDKRLESITARIKQYPKFIGEFKTRIKTPVQLWVDMAKEACGNLPQFFQIISMTAQNHQLDTAALDEAIAETADAVTDYVHWLDTVPGEGEPILGKNLFENLLKVRELPLTLREIVALGEMYLNQEKDRLKKLKSQIDPSSAQPKSTESKPTHEDVIKDLKKALAYVRAITEKEFATLPENERLTIMVTPPFMRHIIPGAAYFPPARFEEDQMGIYFIPSVKNLSAKPDYADLLNASVHEIYPGHHLQMVWANRNPSLVRALSEPLEFIEGWAHYCEERMRDYGLSDTKLQIVQTRGIIFRAVRIIIDVKLHCGEMTFDEAVSLLESEVGVSNRVAVTEVKRYTKTPGQPLSYLLGKHLLLQVQKDVQEHMKDRYTDKKFHDAVLQGGNLPFPYLREELKLKGML